MKEEQARRQRIEDYSGSEVGGRLLEASKGVWIWNGKLGVWARGRKLGKREEKKKENEKGDLVMR